MSTRKSRRLPPTTLRSRPNHLVKHIRVGDRVEVYWPKMRQFYQGTVVTKTKGGKHRIEYDDGDVEVLLMDKEVFRFRGKSAERVAVFTLVSMKNFKC